MRNSNYIMLCVCALCIVGCVHTKETNEIYCSSEGELINVYGKPNECCYPYTPMSGWEGGFDGDCSKIPPPGGVNMCSNCGDGICNHAHGENKCNCKIDCDT